MKLNLVAFHIGENEAVSPDSRATMRITVSPSTDLDQPSRNDPLYWTLTTAIKLFDDARSKKSSSSDLKANLAQALGNRNIEVPSAFGSLKFEVMRHKEPSWWQKVFKFASGDSGKALTAALGFPAITSQAVGFVDQAFSNFEGNSQPLFASRSLQFALSKPVKDKYTSSHSSIGSLTPGTWILARGRDYNLLQSAKAKFHRSFGILAPADAEIGDILTPGFSNPFQQVTYAIFDVTMKEAKLQIDGL